MSVNSLPPLVDFQTQWIESQGTDLFNPEALQLEAALEFMQAYTANRRNTLGTETIPLESALGRVLNKDIIALMDVPPADNSAMDGFAFNSQALQQATPISLDIIGTRLATSADSTDAKNQEIKFTNSVVFDPSQHAYRIMTGAVMPAACDTVIPQEFTEQIQQTISFDPTRIQAGDNRRLQGEDLRIGTVCIPKGRIIGPSDMGLIASMGISTIEVYEKLTVAVFSTGDELKALGSELTPGAIFDSNRYTLLGMLQNLGVNAIDLGIIPDHPEALRIAFASAASLADAIITSGGVSVGQADFTKQVMRELGDVAFWTLAIKPGRPMAFGKIKQNQHEAVLFGLPGNPVAVMITFYQFVQDTLNWMGGASNFKQLIHQAHWVGKFKKRSGRTEFLRGFLHQNTAGLNCVEPIGNQGSGVLSSMSQANCLVILPPELTQIEDGDLVNIVAIQK